jgi:hypothetical protein
MIQAGLEPHQQRQGVQGLALGEAVGQRHPFRIFPAVNLLLQLLVEFKGFQETLSEMSLISQVESQKKPILFQNLPVAVDQVGLEVEAVLRALALVPVLDVPAPVLEAGVSAS